MVLGIFWLVVGGVGWWWMVVGDGGYIFAGGGGWRGDDVHANAPLFSLFVHVLRRYIGGEGGWGGGGWGGWGVA